ncbi:MAG: HNH endonuclease [Actinomycetota bacterium]|nr:HNH endonuclease [Actinomycetota bacterium]MDQ2955740.1 HNH endonuclease [Actinomycetota bacterium]
MGAAEFDLDEWNFLPPLDLDALPDEPPPEREHYGAVTIGSELSSVLFAGKPDSAYDLGQAIYRDWASVQPGLAEISRLGATDFSQLDASQRVDALLALERQRAWLDSLQQELLSLIKGQDSSGKHWCVEEIGAALRLSGGVARSKLANAERLCTQLPETFRALSAGQLSPAQATAISEASFELDDELLPAFENRVLQRADEQSLTQLKRSAKRALLALDPSTAEEKRQRAVAAREVRIAPADQGMAWLLALLPAADAATIYARLDGAARMAPKDDPRTLPQLRADALVNGVLTGIRGQLPVEQGRQPGVNVTVALTTLVGADEQPGWLDGFGPISAGYAREIAHDPTGTWRRLVTDPVNGELLDYSTAKYRPPKHLAEHVIARDGECTFPFCTHSARRADLDHIVPYPQGSTSAANLQPLHRRHHNAKTEAGWRAERDGAAGTTRWTSPQGRNYTTRPPERWTYPDPPP